MKLEAELGFSNPNNISGKNWNAEYTLTLRGFVALITQAAMDNRQCMSVQGWCRDEVDSVLQITMRIPLRLHFLPRQSATYNTPMSPLRAVGIEGHTINAGAFNLIIATMRPGETTGTVTARRLPDSAKTKKMGRNCSVGAQFAFKIGQSIAFPA